MDARIEAMKMEISTAKLGVQKLEMSLSVRKYH
jgi:hypothetical protein